MIDPGVVLIAIGGNALVHEGESGSLCRQQERSAAFARQVVELVEDGWRVLVTHGNGPQVGFILRRGGSWSPRTPPSKGCPSFRCGSPSPTRREASGTCYAWPSMMR
jgi:hypothetical protein